MRRRLIAVAAVLALAGGAQAGPKPPQKPPAQKPPVKTAPAPAAQPEAGPAPSLTGSWRQLFRGPDTFGMLDAKSLRRQGDKAWVDMGLAMRTPIATASMSAGVLINVMEIDCKAGAARTLRTLAFDDEARQRLDTGPLGLAPEKPPPGSTLAVLIEMACGVRPLPEQPQWTDPVIARKGWLAGGG